MSFVAPKKKIILKTELDIEEEKINETQESIEDEQTKKKVLTATEKHAKTIAKLFESFNGKKDDDHQVDEQLVGEKETIAGHEVFMERSQKKEYKSILLTEEDYREKEEARKFQENLEMKRKADEERTLKKRMKRLKRKHKQELKTTTESKSPVEMKKNSSDSDRLVDSNRSEVKCDTIDVQISHTFQKDIQKLEKLNSNSKLNKSENIVYKPSETRNVKSALKNVMVLVEEDD